MKRIIRSVFITAGALWVTAYLIPGVHMSGGIITLLLAAVILGIVTLLVKPFVSLLFLPINLITLGLLSWVINVIILYVFTKVFPSFTITSFRFDGWSSQGFVIPAMTFSALWTAVLASFLLSTISSFFNWLTS